jgi:hypothetical protein
VSHTVIRHLLTSDKQINTSFSRSSWFPTNNRSDTPQTRWGWT